MIWNKQDIEIVKRDYLMRGEYELSKTFNRTPNAVRLMAFRLGIKKLDYRKDVQLSMIEEQVILGGLLGDLYCRIKKTSKNAQIEGAHCREQEPYMLWKLSLLKSITFSLRRMRTGYLFFESRVYPCLNHYHSLFYKNGKKQINKEILSKLNELGLAIWYMDDGSYKSDKSSRIYTNGFSREENLIIIDWFNERFDLKPKLAIHKDQKRYPNKLWYYIRFNVVDTQKLFNLIRDYIHPVMKYKIGEEN